MEPRTAPGGTARGRDADRLAGGAVPSITKPVRRVLSSTPLNCGVTACPAAEDGPNGFWACPVAASGVPYVAGVVGPAVTVGLSCWEPAVVSPVSTCGQKEGVASRPPGMVTGCESVSVRLRP
ncbi:hypothetical protein [Streptomyces chilikensis]|uniref:Uncharacterized protein n=1 Tax=Streptomyces chilikensis TaxID=1194079 RepID=A0ABV3EI63_9ACTN